MHSCTSLVSWGNEKLQIDPAIVFFPGLNSWEVRFTTVSAQCQVNYMFSKLFPLGRETKWIVLPTIAIPAKLRSIFRSYCTVCMNTNSGIPYSGKTAFWGKRNKINQPKCRADLWICTEEMSNRVSFQLKKKTASKVATTSSLWQVCFVLSVQTTPCAETLFTNDKESEN